MSSLVLRIMDKVLEVRDRVLAAFLTQKQEEARKDSLVSLIMDKVLEVPERVGAEFLTQKVSSRTTVQRPDFGNKLGVRCAVDLGAAPRGSPGLIRLSKVIPPRQALLRRQRVGRFLQRQSCLGPLSRRLSSSHTSLCQPEFFCSKESFGGRRKHRGRGDTLASIWVCDLSWKTVGFGWVQGSSSSAWVQVPTCGFISW
ncbi:uncharacterized protein LOC120872441 isoform X2 [Oryx dammah]|uniref:uncharacterized protein LOC120872441 isoform X2 n=1 Tax=Oryx dammah TaxID=59534 RepID=UPI001A9ACE10|nr:uncharacterized protein LOC120872441 isoform X2 [Oryx dammah]